MEFLVVVGWGGGGGAFAPPPDPSLVPSEQRLDLAAAQLRRHLDVCTDI
jgi:hypothetical protein